MHITRVFSLLSVVLPYGTVLAANSALLGWNNLGMHCMDSDYSVFSILPPYNTVEAQLIVGGKLVTNGGAYSVTYQAVTDPSGSINTSSIGKGNFYEHAGALYGASLAPDQGLLAWPMPGPANTPRAMVFERTNAPAPGVATRTDWFRAEGIPITPIDDQGRKNPYPMMRLVAFDSASHPVATNDVVLPVSDEMDCRGCHGSGAPEAGRPAGGWVWNADPERDYRLNILKLHDERQFGRDATLYGAALAARDFATAGLYHGAVASGKAVLCAACHASEALGTTSYPGVKALTAAVHARHAGVQDPALGMTLDDSANRAACYRCHPGSTTRCLRGAMGGAVAADGTMEMQCQSCHGNMSLVGNTNRVGWFMEPSCQSCHTGTATSNSGQIRFTSSFTAPGQVRSPADSTFATTPNTPAAGLSLYRFSIGHGGLQCSACHGSTHAEFPSTHANDNMGTIALQGHAGVLVECTACHTTMPNTPNRGPHGMHAIGQGWVSGGGQVTKHADRIGAAGGLSTCQGCHGVDYRGTVLSRAQASRTLNFEGRQIQLFRGAEVGCYLCHKGPNSDDWNSAAAPVTGNTSAATPSGEPVNLTLPLTGTGAKLRIVSQPSNGAVGLSGTTATYHPYAGFAGTDTFTYAAYDGSKNSALATGSVQVTAVPLDLVVSAAVPGSYQAGWPVPFRATANPVTAPGATYQWTFGDGGARTGAWTTHSYSGPGTYSWAVVATAGSVTRTNTGTIQITAPATLHAELTGASVRLSCARQNADVLLEQAKSLGGDAQWSVVEVGASTSAQEWEVTLPAEESTYFRLRRAW